jgi:hypothetical protein
MTQRMSSMLGRRGAAALVACAIGIPSFAAAQAIYRRTSPRAESVASGAAHFTFTRIRYTSSNSWSHDYPAADRNLSAILDYATNMRVKLDETNVVGLDDPRVFENPIIYISEPGYWRLRDTEVTNLRSYLLKGGLVIFDDFDGAAQWSNMAAQMKRALPEHDFIDITPEHPIFHSFFDVENLYVPNEVVRQVPVYRAMFLNNDPRQRMIALANHNNDIAEYWEWSAEGLFNPDPVNNAYRLGVNYIVYGMTH